MSGLSVLKVFVPGTDLFKMFNSTIGTFHHTTAPALQRSSLAGLRLLRSQVRKYAYLNGTFLLNFFSRKIFRIFTVASDVSRSEFSALSIFRTFIISMDL